MRVRPWGGAHCVSTLGRLMEPPQRRLIEDESEFDEFCASIVKRYPPTGQKRELVGLASLRAIRSAML